MSKILGYDEIGYVAATYKVDATTIAALKTNHLDAATQKVDINGKNLAVTLKSTGEVGFGDGTTASPLFGIIITYEQDGYAAVMTNGYKEGVPTAAAINAGVTTLAVNSSGAVASVASTPGNSVVVQPSTSDNLEATVLLK